MLFRQAEKKQKTLLPDPLLSGPLLRWATTFSCPRSVNSVFRGLSFSCCRIQWRSPLDESSQFSWHFSIPAISYILFFFCPNLLFACGDWIARILFILIFVISNYGGKLSMLKVFCQFMVSCLSWKPKLNFLFNLTFYLFVLNLYMYIWLCLHEFMCTMCL